MVNIILIKKHIKFLNTFFKKSKNLNVGKLNFGNLNVGKLNFGNLNVGKLNFGSPNDEFVYTGPYLRRYRKRNSGFFYEFNRTGIFNVGSQPDLHLSIIDVTGFAVPHITFKPDGENGIAYHYGLKRPESVQPTFWISNHGYDLYDENVIKNSLKDVFNQVIQNLFVHRRDESGKLTRSPYKFNSLGTEGRTKTTPQRLYAQKLREEKYNLFTPKKLVF